MTRLDEVVSEHLWNFLINHCWVGIRISSNWDSEGLIVSKMNFVFVWFGFMLVGRVSEAANTLWRCFNPRYRQFARLSMMTPWSHNYVLPRTRS